VIFAGVVFTIGGNLITQKLGISRIELPLGITPARLVRNTSASMGCAAKFGLRVFSEGA